MVLISWSGRTNNSQYRPISLPQSVVIANDFHLGIILLGLVLERVLTGLIEASGPARLKRVSTNSHATLRQYLWLLSYSLSVDVEVKTQFDAINS